MDSRAWIAWTATAAVLLLTVRNPLYTAVLLLAVQAVRQRWAMPDTGPALPVWRLGLLFIVVSAVLNTLSVHVGATVIGRLPVTWPLIGGNLTVEALVYGAVSGLILLGLLALFAAFNALVPAHDLVRLIPTALEDLAIAIMLAITYVPETIRHYQRIREAQAIRGHRLQGWRAWRPIVVPLLVSGLERAMDLAEVMVARGYAATASHPQGVAHRVALLLALLALFGGWLLTFWGAWYGWLLLVAGSCLLLVLFRRLGRARPRTRYRPSRWGRAESQVVLAVTLPLLIVWLPLLATEAARASLLYTPYPKLAWPVFHPVVGLALTAVAAPALLPRRAGPAQDLTS